MHRILVAIAVAALAIGASAAAQAATDTGGRSTLQQTVTGGTNSAGFELLALGPGQPLVVRQEAGVAAQARRESRRRSLAYFGQLTDFQLADEESPSRVEFLDVSNTPFTAAWRPQEALHPYLVDQAVRQINAFAGASPILQADGVRARMRFALTTGDSADNQQRNEVQQVVDLLEGHTVNPNSGVDNAGPGCLNEGAPHYTGVQDYDDFPQAMGNSFYDPDDPQGSWASWPRYPGLMDRAQQPFQAAGLAVPSYVAFGNHDGLAQGNQAPNASFEAVGTGCLKPLTGTLAGGGNVGGAVIPVPGDPNRQYVSKAQYEALHGGAGHQGDAHGFAFVDPAERAASRGAAGYYAFEPAPGFRFIALDTVSEGGVAGPSADGNLDDPQFRWLTRELQRASAEDKLVVLFGHHPVRSLTANVSDESAPPCIGQDAHGHDANPGCDVDPRSSQPIHLGGDLVTLLSRFPHVIAYVAGHTHENRITAFPRSGGGWWGVETASEADWPQQARLLEVMDNRDGTLSIFGIPLDHAGPTSIPPSGTGAAGLSGEQLAAVSRAMAFNDPQNGGGTGEGGSRDRAVELLVRDPRRTPGGSACRDRTRPRTTVSARFTRLGRRSAYLTGGALDVDCTPTAFASRPGARRVARTWVSVGRVVPGGCRFVTRRGRLSPRRSCRNQFFMRAIVRANRRGPGSSWFLRLRTRLPRGRYFLLARSRDLAGLLEPRPPRRRLVYERLR